MKITLVVETINEGPRAREEAVAVAAELFETVWNSPHKPSLAELLIDGQPAYEEISRRYAPPPPHHREEL